MTKIRCCGEGIWWARERPLLKTKDADMPKASVSSRGLQPQSLPEAPKSQKQMHLSSRTLNSLKEWVHFLDPQHASLVRLLTPAGQKSLSNSLVLTHCILRPSSDTLGMRRVCRKMCCMSHPNSSSHCTRKRALLYTAVITPRGTLYRLPNP